MGCRFGRFLRYAQHLHRYGWFPLERYRWYYLSDIIIHHFKTPNKCRKVDCFATNLQSLGVAEYMDIPQESSDLC